jgi:hypothetical protein
VRVIECAELIAADLFRNAEQNRRRIVFGDVECYLAQLAAHSRGCTCGRCVHVSRRVGVGMGESRVRVFRAETLLVPPQKGAANDALEKP